MIYNEQAITNKNIYNISPAEGSAVKNFFQNLVLKSKIKRKIALSTIIRITISKIVKEFILHIPTEYDQRYQVDDQLALIIQTLCEVYVKTQFKEDQMFFSQKNQIQVNIKLIIMILKKTQEDNYQNTEMK